MRRTKFFVWFILFMAIATGVFFASVAGNFRYESSPFNNNIVNSISFVVALIAFVFSAITYFSIDSVNSITSMSGNILENPNYTINYSTAVSQFVLCRNGEEYTDTLFKIIKPVKKTENCIQFADELQKIVDNIVWFGYVDMKDTTNVKRANMILKILQKEEKRYGKLSNGINYLFSENIKLINYVFEYQRYRHDKEVCICALEDVRGEMLTNPIARIVFYNYLGLDYRRQASRLLDIEEKQLPDFSVENMSDILNNVKEERYTKERVEKVLVLLRRAQKCFIKASQLAEGNIIWEGSILFNSLRAEVVLYLLGESQKKRWDIIEEYDAVIRTRGEERYLFFDENSDGMYLCERYKKRYQRVIWEKEAFIEIRK